MDELTRFNVSGIFVVAGGTVTGHAFAGRPTGHAVEATVNRPCGLPLAEGESRMILFAATIEAGRKPVVRTLQIVDRDPEVIQHPDIRAAITAMVKEIETKVG
jgi:hypothetical protein